MQKITSYIALGSNLNNPAQQIRSALQHIAMIPDTQIINTSPFYQNPPMGPIDQDDFVNAVVEIHTTLAVKTLLHQLQHIENSMGRVRTLRWGPRIIDLDLLLYDNFTCHDDELTLPHPGIYDRLFFIKPLHDIQPNLYLPDGRKLSTLLNQATLGNPSWT
jgi:2-amino-4-hydroxy-6-hydroxymethyldihydropteridine diphosphokinase